MGEQKKTREKSKEKKQGEIREKIIENSVNSNFNFLPHIIIEN